MFIGITLVIWRDPWRFSRPEIRREGFIPHHLPVPDGASMIVTGTAWKWLLNPGMGLDKLLRDWARLSPGLADRPDRGVLPGDAASGKPRASSWRMFSPACAVDQSIIRAAQIDGASMLRIYWKVVLPSLRPVFFSAVMILRTSRSRASTCWWRP